MGAPPARHAGIPLLGLGYAAATHPRRLRARASHAHDADRRLLRRRAAGGDLRDRAGDGRPRRRARPRPDRAAAAELHHRVPKTIASGLTIDSGDYHGSLDRALSTSISTPSAPSRPSGASAATSSSSGRLLDLPRDVRARAVRDPRCDPLRRRRLGRGHDPLPPSGTVQVLTGTSPHGRARDAGRRSPPTSSATRSTRSRCCTATRPSALGMDTYGSRSLTVGGIALYNAAQKIVAKARSSPRTSSASTRASLLRGRHVRQRRATLGDDQGARRSPPGRRTTCRPGSTGSRRPAVYDPPNFSWPGGAHAAVVEIDTETGT